MAKTIKDQRGIAQHCSVCGAVGHKKSAHDRGATKRCNDCQETLPLSAFYPVHRRGNQPMPYCKPCSRRRGAAAYRASPEARMLRLWHSAKSRATKAGIPFSITQADLNAIYERQGGCCYYTGRPMTFEGRGTAISIDKRIPALGYTAENVVLAQWRVNEAKSNMLPEEFIDLCRAVVAHTPSMPVEGRDCAPVEAGTCLEAA